MFVIFSASRTLLGTNTTSLTCKDQKVLNLTNRREAHRTLPKRNALYLYVDILTTTKTRQQQKHKNIENIKTCFLNFYTKT